jgi:uncharacterized phage protein gp47/JayE
MPYNRPTLSDLVSAAEAGFDAHLGTAQARLPASNLSVLARVLAGGEHGLYGFVDWVSRQILPDTAEAEMLDRHGAVWGVSRKSAAKARGIITVEGTNGTLPQGTPLQRSDGVQFVTTEAALVVNGLAAVAPVQAVTAGAEANTAGGVVLKIPSAVAGISASATLTAEGITGGADAETDPSLRARLLARIRQAPHGGAAFDYVTWALEVEDVTRAWVNPGYMGDHTIGVTFLTDQRDDPIPTAADVAAVTAAIEAARPVTASEVFVFAPVPLALDLVISVTPGSDTVKASVLAALVEFMGRESVPGATIPLSRIREAISGAVGETDHQLISPTPAFSTAFGQIPVLGTVTWV